MEGFCLVCNSYWKQIFKSNLAAFESEKLRCISCIRKLLFLPQSPFQDLLNKSVICEDCVHKVLETEKMIHELELLQGRIVQTRRDVESILIRSHNQVVGPADKMTMENLDNINTKATRRQIIELLRLKTVGIPESSPFATLATDMERQNPASDIPSTSTPINDDALGAKKRRGRPFKSASGGRIVKYKGIIPSMPVISARKRKLLDSHRTYNNSDEYSININGNGNDHSHMQESMKMECFKNHPTVSLMRLSPMSSSIKLSEDVTINNFMKKESVLLNKKKKAFVSASRRERKSKLRPAKPRQKAKAIRVASKGKRKIKLTEKAKLNTKLLDTEEEENVNDDEYFVEPAELKKMVQKARKVTKGAKPGDFMCGICSLSFESMDILNIHMNIHIGPTKTAAATATTNSISSSSSGLINCQQCSKKFSSEKSLSDHERAAHTSKKCSKCDMMFSSEEALTLHLVSHKPQPKRRAVIINCDQCDETFSTSYLLNLHTMSHHSKRRTTYNSIESKAKTPLTTTKLATTSPSNNSGLNNDDSYANSTYELVNENGNDHSLATSSYEIVNENGNDDINSSDDDDDQKFACEVCKKKFFSVLVLKLHSLKHRSCEICSLVFSTPDAFSAHRVSSHPDPSSKNPQNTHVCVLCEVSFLSKDILDKHQRDAHTGTKEYDDESPPILDEIHTDSNKLHDNDDDDDLLNNYSSPPKLEEFAAPSIKDFKDIFFKDFSDFS